MPVNDVEVQSLRSSRERVPLGARCRVHMDPEVILGSFTDALPRPVWRSPELEPSLSPKPAEQPCSRPCVKHQVDVNAPEIGIVRIDGPSTNQYAWSSACPSFASFDPFE